MTPRDIFLLDMDSVLVRPLGYRAALKATVDHFRARMGLPAGPPTDAEIDVFEAHGFGSEWHSAPACVAALLAEAGAAHPDVWRATLDATLAAIARAALPVPRPDYAGVIRAIEAQPGQPGALAPLRALAYFTSRTPPQARLALEALLAHTYDIRAPATRVFQHYTLGSARFSQVYGFGPDFDAESTLMTLDEALLSDAGRRLLRDSRVPHAVYTARPSLPPTPADAIGYAPEAEMGCALVGLDGAPVIGYGHVSWLARRHGAHPDAYTKPSPVQALAAVGAALATGREGAAAALESARALVEGGKVAGPLAALGGDSEGVRISVFEDTPGGALAVRRAGEVLRAAGLPVTVRVVGVGATPVKRRSLEPVADILTADVNEALRLALTG